jgi:sulfoxide reductase heme-binding subunit YedZ
VTGVLESSRTAAPPAAPRRRPLLLRPWVKPAVFALCLLPFARLLYGAVSSVYGVNTLGPNPAETLIRASGDWTLRMLCLTLAVTPLRRWLGQPALARLRRMLGLFTFFYACVHFLCYGWLDMGLVVQDIVRDVAKRPFILVGTSALLLMTPLALTSFNRAIRAMGAPRWQALHRAVYAVALLALLHFFWMRAGKHNFAEVAVYAAIVGVLLAARVWHRFAGARSHARAR